MLNLSGATATVTAWTSAELNANCTYSEPFYAPGRVLVAG